LFSATFRYALVSLHETAAADSSLKAAEIAALHNIPSSYLNNVLFELRRLGFVTSKTGSKGGYQLAIPPQEINLRRLHQGLAGAAGLDRHADAVGTFLWLQQMEDRWLAELERTSLADVQLANDSSAAFTIKSKSFG
jgi:Rrf2 family protein